MDELAEKSVDVICSLQEGDGGILATAGDDAYPFVYPRDASFMSMALNSRGMPDRSKAFYRYVAKLKRPGGEVFHRYHRGHPYVTQKGEADVAPIVIQGVYDTYRSTEDSGFLGEMWEVVSSGANYVLSSIDPEVKLLYTNRSIHENQSLEEGFEIWANSAAVKGLLDASRIAGVLGHGESGELWLARAKDLWATILLKLYDRETGLFMKNLRKDGTIVRAPDVSQLSPFYFGLSDDMQILGKTLAHLRATLWNESVGGVNRFRDFDLVADWHWYTGGTGASWPLFTLWMARFYRRFGEPDSAEDCLRFVRNASTGSMEIPEKVAPLKGYVEWKENEIEYNERVQHGIARADKSSTSIPGYVAWACPLGWSHAEYLLLDRDDYSASWLLANGHEQNPAVEEALRGDREPHRSL